MNLPRRSVPRVPRRTLLAAALAGSVGHLGRARAALKKSKITRVRFYENPLSRPLPNQSAHIVTVETDAGLTGIGEGGSADMAARAGSFLIGADPTRIEELWQLLYRGEFYPAGRERLHALGALDLALWDLKGKMLDLPVHQLLGGLTRDNVQCYATAFPNPRKAPVKEHARACIKAGFKAFRTSVVGPQENNGVFDARRAVDETVAHSKQIRAGVEPGGEWCIDYHTRLDFADAVRLSQLLEPLNPFFCEDLVRSENPEVYRELRKHVRVPIAVGEQFGDRWDINVLVENHLIDHSRVTIPNVGGITEMLKLAALCETHYVSLVPHFTGPVSVAALVNVLCAFAGPATLEMAGDGGARFPHLPRAYDFKNGRLWPNNRPGLGVELDTKPLKLVAEVTRPPSDYHMYRRPDGSLTNW